MTFDEWFDHYSPIPNPDGESGFCVDDISYMYETFDKDFQTVSTAAVAAPGTVWTILEGEDGKLYVVDGFRLVNRIGFFITERANEGGNVSILCE